VKKKVIYPNFSQLSELRKPIKKLIFLLELLEDQLQRLKMIHIDEPNQEFKKRLISIKQLMLESIQYEKDLILPSVHVRLNVQQDKKMIGLIDRFYSAVTPQVSYA
jgi:hypothetical protein